MTTNEEDKFTYCVYCEREDVPFETCFTLITKWGARDFCDEEHYQFWLNDRKQGYDA